jgi:hypothetical protein
MTIGLSGQIVQAALGVVAVQAVIATWVIDRRVHLTWFYVVSACAVGALLLSIIVGGRGVAEIIGKGYHGTWLIRTKRHKFNAQAILTLLGAILVVVSVFLGDPKPPAPTP